MQDMQCTLQGEAHPLMGYARCWLPRTRALISCAFSFFRNASNFASSTSLRHEPLSRRYSIHQEWAACRTPE